MCYDDDEDLYIAITTRLTNQEAVNSLKYGIEILDTIPATESDEVIKSSVENLVPIPSKSEGILDSVCDVSLCNNPTPLEAFKEHSKTIVDSNNDSSLSDDDSYENIDYVDASIPMRGSFIEGSNPKLSALIWKRIVVAVPYTRSDYSLRIMVPFYDTHIEEKSDFYHEEFADELAHIISPPEYDCFCFKNEPERGDFTMDVVNDIFPTGEPRVHVLLNIFATHTTLHWIRISYF
ncbi:hypothetical protein Tco_0546879 [Tanacetum coccineum]